MNLKITLTNQEIKEAVCFLIHSKTGVAPQPDDIILQTVHTTEKGSTIQISLNPSYRFIAIYEKKLEGNERVGIKSGI